jgi:hypothetical protein
VPSFTLFHFITPACHIPLVALPAKIATPSSQKKKIYSTLQTTSRVIFRFQTHSNSSKRIENVKNHGLARKKRRKRKKARHAPPYQPSKGKAHIHSRKEEGEEEE